MTGIRSFQRALYSNYKSDLSLPDKYKYMYGNPVQPVVPLDTTKRGIFIIGAYPSAQFATINNERDVPVGDNLWPFPDYRYFDGSRIRTVASGEELVREYLEPLGLSRDRCWITDLVRIFLFKKGHLAKYRRLDCVWPERETRSKFDKYAIEGIHWLEAEIKLAQPRLVITLGSEVAGILQSVTGQKRRNELLGGDLKEFNLGAVTYPVLHMAHPGIVMRNASERNPWPRLHWEKHIPEAKKALSQILRR
jgi:uracil-DNA glycosylase